MPLTTADAPDPKKPEPAKAEPAKVEAPKSAESPEKTGLAEAALSTDPLVQKLMWDRGTHLGGKLTEEHNVAPDAHERRIAAIDGELRKLGFDL